ncbi:MAG: glycosyltransferase [Deltaproteobacteria bacterium]|nr:glycosyltransferase [Deltaproteobacteria bacterium]
MKAILALNRAPHYGALKAALQRKPFLQQMLERVDKIIAPSLFLQEMYIRNGISASALKHLSFGLDTSHLNGHKKNPADRLRIAFIGTLTAHKGCHILVEAFRKIESDRLQLAIYGNTEQFAEYTARIKKQMGKDERIALKGTFPPEDLGKVFSEIDILVVPSIWYENTPLIVYSALATKTPVIATNLGGLTELIKPGVNGFLFEAGDVTGLKACMEKIVHSPDLLQRLEEQIEPVKNMETHAEEILQEYRGVGVRV